MLRLKYANNRQKDDLEPLETPVECVCPRCERTHTANLYWTGRGRPRKFCQVCIYFAGRYEEAISSETHTADIR